jgi:hypothetical protein
MACLIANGRAEACKDSIGGIRNIYFINYQIEDADVSYDVTNTDLITDVNSVDSLYKFELKGSDNTFEQTINSDRNAGTTFFTQTLTVKFKKQDVATTKNIKLLSYGRPHIVIETNAGQFMLMGLKYGADVTAGTISTGGAMGDFSGYSLTFTAEEPTPANFINASTQAALVTLFSPATLVVS